MVHEESWDLALDDWVLDMSYVISAPQAEVGRILADMAGTNPATGTARYYAHDHLGSTRGLYSAGKAFLGSYDYTPYGSTYRTWGASISTLGGAFTGKPWDNTTKLYYFPYRQYSPTMARWTSRDPLGMVDGPNMYAYVMGNPVNRVDPLGLFGPGALPPGFEYYYGTPEDRATPKRQDDFCIPVFTQNRLVNERTTRIRHRSYTGTFLASNNTLTRTNREVFTISTYVRRTEWYCRGEDECDDTYWYWKTTYTSTKSRGWRHVSSRLSHTAIGGEGTVRAWCPFTNKPIRGWAPLSLPPGR